MGRFFFQDCLMQCKNIDLKHSVQANIQRANTAHSGRYGEKTFTFIKCSLIRVFKRFSYRGNPALLPSHVMQLLFWNCWQWINEIMIQIKWVLSGYIRPLTIFEPCNIITSTWLSTLGHWQCFWKIFWNYFFISDVKSSCIDFWNSLKFHIEAILPYSLYWKFFFISDVKIYNSCINFQINRYKFYIVTEVIYPYISGLFFHLRYVKSSCIDFRNGFKLYIVVIYITIFRISASGKAWQQLDHLTSNAKVPDKNSDWSKGFIPPPFFSTSLERCNVYICVCNLL